MSDPKLASEGLLELDTAQGFQRLTETDASNATPESGEGQVIQVHEKMKFKNTLMKKHQLTEVITFLIEIKIPYHRNRHKQDFNEDSFLSS